MANKPKLKSAKITKPKPTAEEKAAKGKMTFQITTREGTFGKINPRNETHGKEKVPATDIPVVFKGTKRDLDLLFPRGDGQKTSELLFSKDGHLVYPHMTTLYLERAPEDIVITIYAEATKKGSPLVFDDRCKAKDITVKLTKRYESVISMKLQVHVDPDAQAARLYELMDATREFEIDPVKSDWVYATGLPANGEDDGAEQEDSEKSPPPQGDFVDESEARH